MQLGAPFNRRLEVGLAPKPRNQRAHQQLLRQTHQSVRGHFKPAQLDQTQTSVRRIGGIKLIDTKLRAMRITCDVDEDVPESAVNEPRWAVTFHRLRYLAEGDFEFVQIIGPGLIDARRLAGRSDEKARKEIG